MIGLGLWIPIVLVGAQAQTVQEEAFDTVEMRVTAVRPRQAVVDRGTIDGLAVKDRVVFRPRTGRTYEGTVVEVGERDAVVSLDDPAITPTPGTKADARIPGSRRAPPPVVIPPAPAPSGVQAPEPQSHAPWERAEDEWKSGEPLLAHIRPFHPDEREPRISGTAFTIFDFAHTTEGPHTDTIARAGTSLLFENPFSNGGDVHFDSEVDYRRAKVPVNDNDGEEKLLLLVDRLSYSWGGNRFEANRYEVGRFLQHDMPEFGVLDGGQWSHRLPGGNTFGASLGYIPQQVLEQSTGTDLQMAAYYRWAADESEQISLTGGYQKTFHNFDADRDLFVGKLVYLPVLGWDLTGTVWVDLYTAGDEAKGAGLGLTQAYLSTGKRWESGSSVRFTYTHGEFPENELDAFTPVTFAQLADDHADRAAVTTRQAISNHFATFLQGGVWTDQDDNGGDGEVGMDFEDFAFQGSQLELAGFGTAGRFSTTIGGRVALSRTMESSSWHLGYEFTYDDIAGFDGDNNSLPQHRAYAAWDVHTASRWSISLSAEALLFDQETGVQAGIFIQRSF